MKNYHYQLDLWAITLFVVVMVPNVIWGIYSAPNDVLHVDSVTPSLVPSPLAAEIGYH